MIKKIYWTFCTLIVTAVIGLIVYIKGFISGLRMSKYDPEGAVEANNSLDKISDSWNHIKADAKATKKQATEELKGYSTIHAVEDSEEE